MKNLWTPWRMDHVQGKAVKTEGCLFQPSTTRYDKQRLLLLQDTRGMVLLNRFPYTNGHLLIAPCRHVPCLTELNTKEADDLMELLRLSTEIIKKRLSPDGLNVGCNIGESAGAGIADHLHFHLVPRWQNDHNFITVISEIRTIPEHIDTTFDNLLPDFLSL